MKVNYATFCVVWKDEGKDAVLLIRRPKQKHHLSGQWFFPGGCIERGEHPKNSATREVAEETNAVVYGASIVDAYQYTESWDDDGLKSADIGIVVFQAYYGGGTPTRTPEADEVRWVSLRHLKNYLTQATIWTHLSDEVRHILGIQ